MFFILLSTLLLGVVRYDNQGHKVHANVLIDEHITLSSFERNGLGGNFLGQHVADYELSSVVVHEGQTLAEGKITCFN